MPSRKYREYLKSPQWKNKREQVLERDNHTCRKCRRKGLTLHVHHLTYERIFDEMLTDLITLCVDCHDQVHGIGEKPKKPPKQKKKKRKKSTYKPKTPTQQFNLTKTVLLRRYRTGEITKAEYEREMELALRVYESNSKKDLENRKT